MYKLSTDIYIYIYAFNFEKATIYAFDFEKATNRHGYLTRKR